MNPRRLLVPLLGCVALAGCTAAAPEALAPPDSPTAAAATDEPTPPPLAWTPDLTLERDFDGATCTTLLHIADSPSHPTEVTAARAFLAAGDWSTVEVTLDDMAADQLEAARGQGRSDAELLMGLVNDVVRGDMTAAGHGGTWLSTEARVSCS